MSVLRFFNRQKTRAIDGPTLRKIARCLLHDLLPGVGSYELAIHLVGEEEMARVNMNFLQHEGSTDVITFDYGEGKMVSPLLGGRKSASAPLGKRTSSPQPSPPSDGGEGEERRVLCISGELFISVDDAVSQAKEFRTTWQSELVRYAVHGVLHLLGHDDLKPTARRSMKREENRLLKELSRRFALGKLERVKHGSQRK